MKLVVFTLIFLTLIAYVFNAIVLITFYIVEIESFNKGYLTKEQYLGFILSTFIAIIPIVNIGLMYFFISEYISFIVEKYNLLKRIRL